MEDQVEFKEIVSEIKRLLKSRGVTYKVLAKYLEISESGVKKLFASNDCSIVRINQICKFLGTSLLKLIHGASEKPEQTFEFSEEQRKYFLKNMDALRYYWKLAYIGLSAREIEVSFGLTSQETQNYLLLLDRLNLIELYEDNKIKILKVHGLWVGDNLLIKKIVKDWGHQLITELAEDPYEKEKQISLRCFKLGKDSYLKLLDAFNELNKEFHQISERDARLYDKGDLNYYVYLTGAQPGDLINRIKD